MMADRIITSVSPDRDLDSVLDDLETGSSFSIDAEMGDAPVVSSPQPVYFPGAQPLRVRG